MSKRFPTVLVIDDDLSILDLVPYYLAMKGIKADTVSCGEEALDKIKNYKYDAIIVDINMPRMDGITFSKIVREDFPIVMISIEKSKDVFERIVDLCDCYVDKSKLGHALAPATFKAMERYDSDRLLPIVTH